MKNIFISFEINFIVEIQYSIDVLINSNATKIHFNYSNNIYLQQTVHQTQLLNRRIETHFCICCIKYDKYRHWSIIMNSRAIINFHIYFFEWEFSIYFQLYSINSCNILIFFFQTNQNSYDLCLCLPFIIMAIHYSQSAEQI